MNRHSTTSPAHLLFSVTTGCADAHAAWFGIEHPVDEWNRLVAAALLENSITLLKDSLAAVAWANAPLEIRQRVDSLSLIWEFKLRHLERKLIQAVELLSAAGIEVMLLKGAALALTVYPEFSDRPMADLDLMVEPHCAEEAHKLLRRAGWKVEIAPLPFERWKMHHHLPPLADTTGSGLRLELHTSPLPNENPFALSAHEFRKRCRSVKVGNAVALIPDSHIHAVHAAIHFAFSHQFASGGLNFFRDIARLAKSSGWSWDLFTYTALRTRAQHCCYWALRLGQALTSLDVPEHVLKNLSPPISARFAAVIEKHLCQVVLRAENACPSVELRRRMWAFALCLPATAFRNPEDWQTVPTSGIRNRRLRRFGNHVLRAPAWSRYVASLLPLLIAT